MSSGISISDDDARPTEFYRRHIMPGPHENKSLISRNFPRIFKKRWITGNRALSLPFFLSLSFSTEGVILAVIQLHFSSRLGTKLRT